MKVFFLTTLFFASTCVIAQVSSKIARDFGSPIITDSSSTYMIPTLYNSSLFTSDKLSIWGDFYANLIFYNFKSDSSKKLFEKDTYIFKLTQPKYSYYQDGNLNRSLGKELIFYRVMNVDLNKNDRIDYEDPMVLYVSDIYGNHLKMLTSETENVVEFDLYENQKIALVKIQRDTNGDGNFNSKDNSFYYVKLNLADLTFGNKIETK